MSAVTVLTSDQTHRVTFLQRTTTHFFTFCYSMWNGSSCNGQPCKRPELHLEISKASKIRSRFSAGGKGIWFVKSRRSLQHILRLLTDD
eukprot:393769-Amphidinium_carterae.1